VDLAPPTELATPAGTAVLTFQDVSIGFGERDVLHKISFDLAPGETKVLLGENASGKTLLLKLGAGLIRPDSGRISLLGKDLGQLTEDELLALHHQTGFVFQEGALFDSMTVGDNVAFPLREVRTPEEKIEARVRDALRFVQIEEAIDKLPGELSGGMRRRASIARAIVAEPQVVFYDSPTAGLDPVTSQRILSLILRGRDLHGITAIVATHRIQDALGLAHYCYVGDPGSVVPLTSQESKKPHTSVMVLKDGGVYFSGSADDLLDPADPYLKEFRASAG
jgi:phospholipid/cholesterol/gamma-HCH transport system ATP-binding protein